MTKYQAWKAELDSCLGKWEEDESQKWKNKDVKGLKGKSKNNYKDHAYVIFIQSETLYSTKCQV